MNQQQLQIYFEPWTRERMCHQLYKCLEEGINQGVFILDKTIGSYSNGN